MSNKKPVIVEKRAWPLEVRESQEGAGYVLDGYASVFGDWADIGGMFMERIMPGAFKKTLAEADQVALWNHNDQYPLGRKSMGTLELREDDHGLAFTIQLDDEIQYHRDAYLAARKGLIQGASFRFSVPGGKEDWDRDDDEQLRRTIRELRLFEVSPVTFPAYESTELQARAAEYLSAVEVPLINNDTTVEPEEDHSAAGERERLWRARQFQTLEIYQEF